MNEHKFDAMGQVYAQFRPSYPQAFLDYLYGDVGISSSHSIADIGAGTGILTKQLLERGNRVFAVEPNADMRHAAQEQLGGADGYVSVNGTAENTTLEDKSVDFITVGTAFHWFNRPRFRIECQRILKPAGKVILVWNDRDPQSELVVAFDTINRRYCPEYVGPSGSVHCRDKDNLQDFFTDAYQVKSFPNDLIYEENSFIGRTLSSSYALKETDAQFAEYITALRALFHNFSQNGKLLMPNVAFSYVGSVSQ